MSIEQFRAEVVTAIEQWRLANFPDMDVVYENSPAPEEDKISSPWLDVEIRWYGGAQVAIGAPRAGRYSGVVSVKCFTRAGEGTQQADRIGDSLQAALAGFRTTGAWLDFPEPYTPNTALGWHKRGLMFPFKLSV